MNKFLIASVALLGLAGVAAAQEAPAIYGSETNVLNTDGSQAPVSGRAYVLNGQANATVPSADGFDVNASQNYSGK